MKAIRVMTVEAILRGLDDRGLGDLAREVARRHGIPIYEVVGRKRNVSVCSARKELYAVLRQKALSLPEIGALLGRDHTTVLMGLRSYHAQSETSPEVQYRVAV